MTKSICAIAACLAMSTSAIAENSVVVESKSVPARADGVTVGVYLTNEARLTGVVLPMEIRSVTPGAFISDTLIVEPINRLTEALTGIMVTTFCPSEDNTRYWECNGSGYKTHGLPDFISPDAFLHASAWGEFDTTLAPGSDGDFPGGSPSVELTFGVTSVNGTFEIDTTCITPANHLLFIGYGNPQVVIAPAFTKGVIEIGCECDCHADPQCDGYYDIVDWMKIKNVAQGSSGPIPDPNPFCPVVTTDVNCDGVTNNTDKNLMYGVVFLGDNPDLVFCNPCP